MTFEVITGPMFSGKTSELIRLVEREVYAGRRGAIFKPALGGWRGRREVAANSGLRYSAYSVGITREGMAAIPGITDGQGIEVVGVDEVQFSSRGIVLLLDSLAYRERVVACGLNMDFRVEPFSSTMELAARADSVRHLTAICVVCGRDATRTQRLVRGKPAPLRSPVIMTGGKELYEPRCRICYETPT